MNKLTDTEIVRAYELHLLCSATACEDCPITDDDCERVLSIELLSLISRQKAEIEKLSKIIDNNQIEVLDKIKKKELKSDAYKEFAEELANRIVENYNITNRDSWYITDTIDKLLEEMVNKIKIS